MLPSPLKRVLIEGDELRDRVQELGRELARDYAGREPVLIGVLTGAVVFLSDLIRATPIDLLCDFMAVSSYGSETRSSGVVRITSDLGRSIEGRHVLIVEDIIDTGRTVSYLRRNLETRRPESVRICALLDKVERREVPVELDYVGFAIPDEFVVGYGLDHAGLYRNLPHIAVLDASKLPAG